MTIVLALAALSLAASFVFAEQVVTGSSGYPKTLGALGLGYWLWLASMTSFAISVTVKLFEREPAI